MSDFIKESSWNFTEIKWLDKYMVGHSGFIAGGCFKHIFNDEKVKDVDIFFNSEEEHAKAVNYFKEQTKEFHQYYENKKVVAFNDSKTGLTIELVKATFGTPQDVIDNFDFTITKFAYYKHTEDDENGEETTTYRCVYHPKYFEHLVLKRIVLDDKIPFPISTFERMFRYAKYGYFPCRETKQKIIEAIHDIPQLPNVSLSLYDGLD